MRRGEEREEESDSRGGGERSTGEGEVEEVEGELRCKVGHAFPGAIKNCSILVER